MSLEDFDKLNIPDAAPVVPVLEAGALPKFDMHLYRSSLNESHVRYLVKLYGIPEELHPAGKECKSCLKDAPTSLNKWKDKFLLVDRRAAPIAMAWRHHDSSVADPFPKPSEYSERLLYLFVGHLLVFYTLQVATEALLPPVTARVTHLAPPAARLEDIPPKTGDMIVSEIQCKKVVDDKEKKKKKAEEKAATRAPAVNIQAEAAIDKPVGREGPRKKRRVHTGAQAPPGSEHVSSPSPLNQAKPLEALADEEHVSPPASGEDNANSPHVLEGHGDNEGGLSGLQICSSLVYPSGMVLCRRRDTLEEPAPKNVVSDAEASKLFRRTFWQSSLTPQWGLTNSSRMDNLRECRDMMENLFTPADEEFSMIVFGMSPLSGGPGSSCAYDEKVFAYDQLSKNYDGALTREKSLQDRLEELEEEKKEAEILNSSHTDRIRQLEEALKQAEADAEQLRAEKVHFSVEAGKGEIVRQKIVNLYLPTFATPNIDPTSSKTFLTAYEKLFDQRYPYLDKVARMYLLDPTELQNIMLDETGHTLDGGPRDTPTASYA
uniref:Transposase (Putative), gypsy type n=1 Tax=Tanacetum cinerariifolium TaxID=118510 RepID=A0A6L2NB88_TANCI|nr:hypothetical protein [Tanacetum cinerariifolium]